MEIRISVAEGDLADLMSLDRWLRGERELAGLVELIGRPPATGTLGAGTDALIALVSSGGTATVLAGALKAWLTMNRRVRIKVHPPSGPAVEIDMENVRTGRVDVEAVIRQALGYDAESRSAGNSAADGGPAALATDAAGAGLPAPDDLGE